MLGDGFAALDRGGAVIGVVCIALGWFDARATNPDRLRALLPLAGVFAHLTSALAITSCVARQISSGSCSTHPA